MSFKTLKRQEGGSHYSKYAIQPVEYAMANKLDYCMANAVKYCTRHRDKNGVEDLKKAIHNIQIEAELVYGVDLTKTEEKPLRPGEFRYVDTSGKDGYLDFETWSGKQNVE